MKKSCLRLIITLTFVMLTGVAAATIDEPDPFKVVDACQNEGNSLVNGLNKSTAPFNPLLGNFACSTYFTLEFPLNQKSLESKSLSPCDCLLQEKFTVNYSDLEPFRDAYQSEEVTKIKAENYGKDIGLGLNTLREVLSSERGDLISFLREEANIKLALQCLGNHDEKNKSEESCEDQEKEALIGKVALGKILEIMDRASETSIKQEALTEKLKDKTGSLSALMTSLVMNDPKQSPELSNLKVMFEEIVQNNREISAYIEGHPFSKRDDLIKASQAYLFLEKSEMSTRVGPTKDKAEIMKVQKEIARIVSSSYVWSGLAKHFDQNESDVSKILRNYQASLILQFDEKKKSENADSYLTEIEKKNITQNLYHCADASKAVARLCSKSKPSLSDVKGVRDILKVPEGQTDILELRNIEVQQQIANLLTKKDELKSKQLHAFACFLQGRTGNPKYRELMTKNASDSLKVNDEIEFDKIIPRATPVSDAQQLLEKKCGEIALKHGASLLSFGAAPILAVGEISQECAEYFNTIAPNVSIEKEDQLPTINQEIPKAQSLAKQDNYEKKPKIFSSPELRDYFEKIDKGDYVAARNSISGLSKDYQLSSSDYQMPVVQTTSTRNVASTSTPAKSDSYSANYSSSLIDRNNSRDYNPKKFVMENKPALAKVSPQNLQRLEEQVEAREVVVKDIAKTEKEIERVKTENPEDKAKLRELESRLNELSGSLDEREQQIAKLVEENRKLAEELAKVKNQPAPVASAPAESKFTIKPKAKAPKVETKVITVAEGKKENQGESEVEKEAKSSSQGLAIAQSSRVFRGPSSIAQMEIPDAKSVEFKEFAEDAFQVGYEYEEGKVFIYDEEGRLKILEKVGDTFELRDAPYTINPKSEIHLMDEEDFLENALGDEAIDSSKKGPVRYPEIPQIMDQYFRPN